MTRETFDLLPGRSKVFLLPAPSRGQQQDRVEPQQGENMQAYMKGGL